MPSSAKGQAALEYLMVLGIALTLSAPFIIRSQQSILDLGSSAQMMEAQTSLDRIESSAETVNAAGEPARRTFAVELPENLNESMVLERSVVLTLETRESNFNVSKSFSFNLSGTLPDEGGRYLVTARADAGEVDLGLSG